MTINDFQGRALAEVPPGDPTRKEFGLILGAILFTIISHYVERCLQRHDHAKVSRPGLFDRLEFRKFAREVIREDPRASAHGPPTPQDIEQATDACLAAAAKLTPAEFAGFQEANRQ